MPKKAGIETLHERRKKMCLKFAKKCFNNQRCTNWFVRRPVPLYVRRSSVSYSNYYDPIARTATDRYRNSPKNDLRRLLNSHEENWIETNSCQPDFLSFFPCLVSHFYFFCSPTYLVGQCLFLLSFLCCYAYTFVRFESRTNHLL